MGMMVKTHPTLGSLLLGPFAIALLVLQVCKELIKYQYVMFGQSVWQAQQGVMVQNTGWKTHTEFCWL